MELEALSEQEDMIEESLGDDQLKWHINQLMMEALENLNI